MTDPITTPAQMREAAARLADETHRAYIAAKGRNPDDYVSEYSKVAAAIRALPVAEPVSSRDAIRPHLIAERMRWWSPEYPGQTPPKLAVWWRDEPEDGLSGFDTKQDRDAFQRGEPGPFIRRITGNEFPQLPWAEPLCTWPSCGHTAKGQCRTYTSGQLIAPNDASITATITPVAEPEPLAVKVKPLVWTAVGAALWARDIYGDHYEIEAKDEAVVIDHPRLYGGYAVASIDDAKSAAEADHAARILSQIDAVSVAQVRAEALEEAAALPPYDGDGDPAGQFDHHVFVKRDAIRALIKREPT